jgi:hypothetical protein
MIPLEEEISKASVFLGGLLLLEAVLRVTPSMTRFLALVTPI